MVRKTLTDCSHVHSAFNHHLPGHSLWPYLARPTAPRERGDLQDARQNTERMSTSQASQPGESQAAQRSLPGSSAANGQESAEQSLVKLYMDLTGESESQARGVLM